VIFEVHRGGFSFPPPLYTLLLGSSYTHTHTHIHTTRTQEMTYLCTASYVPFTSYKPAQFTSRVVVWLFIGTKKKVSSATKRRTNSPRSVIYRPLSRQSSNMYQTEREEPHTRCPVCDLLKLPMAYKPVQFFSHNQNMRFDYTTRRKQGPSTKLTPLTGHDPFIHNP